MSDENRAATSNTALLLIDFQHDFLDEDGRMPIARNQTSSVIEAARTALSTAKAANHLILAIGNEFKRSDWLMNTLRRHAAKVGSRGAHWDRRIPLDGLIYLPKWAASAFSNPQLAATLAQHDVGTLRLAGLFARACVSATGRDAIGRGFKVQILEDAVACTSDRSRDAALARLRRAGASITRGASHRPSR